MKKKTILTKDEIAAELNLSVRSVERYIHLAQVEPAERGSGRGKQSKFRREDVERITAAYRKAAEEREQQSTALATTKPATLAPVAIVGELITSNREGFESFQSTLDAWSIRLTRAETIERTGLPVTWFDAGVRAGRLRFVGAPRGVRSGSTGGAAAVSGRLNYRGAPPE